MIEHLPLIGGIGGISALAGVILMYFKWKPKHPVDVKTAEVKIRTDDIENDSLVIAQIKGDYIRISEENRMFAERLKGMEKKVDDCNRRHEQSEIENKGYKEQIERIMGRCKLNCLVD